MDLVLKKVKIHEDMSEETTCFSAEMWEKGVHIADVKNDGRGGCHDIRPTKGNEKAAWKYNENLSLEWNRENFPIDHLLGEWDAVTRHQAKKLVLVENATGKVFTIPLKHSITNIKKTPKLLTQVIGIAQRQKDQGFTVINRNITLPTN
tara:strand:- start:144 stop:590 length:447 start_codon:yes stop_codon:yes gene_type:complete